jgi:tetratricopeptide (TPR) repeat protein
MDQSNNTPSTGGGSPDARALYVRSSGPPPVAGSFDGSAILEEVAEPLGVVLFQAARDGLLWATAAPGERAGIFAPRARLPRLDGYRGLRGALHPFVRMVRKPRETDPAELLEASGQVCEWAEHRGHLRTAGAFAEIAARLFPSDGALAVRVGQFARRAADYGRAEAWLGWANVLARRAGDWRTYCTSLAALGNLHWQRGNYPKAWRRQAQCLRRARLLGLRDFQASALHNLFALSVEMDDFQQAETYYKAAFEVYGPTHPRMPYFAHDVAWFYMLRGHNTASIQILKALLSHFQKPTDQLLVWGGLARTAAGAGRRELYRQARGAVWDIVREHGNAEHAATALLDAARGAEALRDWHDCRVLAEAALGIAQIRGEGKVSLSAEALVRMARIGLAPGAVAGGAHAGEVVAGAQPETWTGPLLTREIVRALR